MGTSPNWISWGVAAAAGWSLLTTACGGPHLASLPPGYAELDRFEKQRILWEERILPTEYDELPSESVWVSVAAQNSPGAASALADVETTMEHQSDEAPEGRYKMIHTMGVVGTVALEASDPADGQAPFTGLLNPGPAKIVGLARFSLAAPPSVHGYTPGVGLKLLVDGRPSGDLLFMHDVKGRDDRDFFAREMSTDIAPAPEDVPYLTMLEDRFETVAEDGDASRINLDHLAPRTADGAEVDEPIVADALRFVPAEEVTGLIPSDSERDFRAVSWTSRLTPYCST